MNLILGIESPIGPNQNLLTLRQKELVASRDAFSSGTRLSAVGKTPDNWTRLEALVRALLADRNDVFEMVVWSGSRSAMTWTRAEMQRMRLVKEDWSVITSLEDDTSTFVATRSIDGSALSLPLPSYPLGRSIVLAVSGLSVSELASRFREDLAELARRALAPSHALIQWILERAGLLVYHVSDDFNRLGVIVVSPFDELPVAALRDADHVYRNAEAGLVWQAAP